MLSNFLKNQWLWDTSSSSPSFLLVNKFSLTHTVSSYLFVDSNADNIIHDTFLKAKRDLLELVHDMLNLICPSFPRPSIWDTRQLSNLKGMPQIGASKNIKFRENSPLPFFHLQFVLWLLSLCQAIFGNESLSHHLMLWCSINAERNQSEIAIHYILIHTRLDTYFLIPVLKFFSPKFLQQFLS